MAKSANPMEAYRREQKKKELKKHRQERQKDKQTKLSSMDPTEIQAQLKNLERQVALNPTDGPTRKRKQELEDTLRAVVKKQKEVKDEEQKKQAGAPPAPLMTMKELTAANKEKFQNPENSIYYHLTLNPFGAPPPGKPQVYRDGTVVGVGTAARGPHKQGGYSGRPQQRGFRGSPPPRGSGFRGPPPLMPREMARRPGKRPPLPSGPPPPGTIQVPMRPPLPSGALPVRPPPPPPVQARVGGMVPPPPPPPPYPTTDTSADTIIMQVNGDVNVEANSVAAPCPALHEDEDSVVAPYPPPDDFNQDDEEMDEEAAESQAQLRSLVPVALRVQRQVAPSSSVASVGNTPAVPAPRPVPAPAPAPQPPVNIAPPPSTSERTDKSSVSNEFDAFMEEVKELL
ncbi:hypothetical protein V7S43_002462 [Phytophthora oleae]|uniref:Wbp11/ELF5/Saf1 N-terminal domain-containing protein n=1 Tax=Phytophthora oleae TaxID=2107226 RepID=A0ABD3G3G5_9STRA